MADKVTVSSHNSYGSRVGNSLKNIFVGILFIIGSIALLIWNENNYVKQKAALQEGASIVQETTSDQVNPDLEGKEIYVVGETASDAEILQDDTFGVVTDNLKLKRSVEMYQWYEESDTECHDNVGGSEDCDTTYTYDKKWSDEHIDSSDFYTSNGHENPSNREYESQEWEKSPITLGAYTLGTVFVGKLTNYSNINLTEQNINIPEKYRLDNKTTTETTETTDATETTETTEATTVEDNNNSYLYGDSDHFNDGNTDIEVIKTVTLNKKFHVNSDYIYIGSDPTSPTIGDLKIRFSSVKPGMVSIVGKQMGNELSSYTVSNGRSISLLEQGNVTAEDMFLHAQQANKQMTRIIRLIGLILMYCGFSMLFQFIETLAKVLPFLANIIGVGRSILALGLTLVVGFVTIGLARLAVRPVIGISCLVVATGGIFLLVKSKKSKKEEKAETVEVKDGEQN